MVINFFTLNSVDKCTHCYLCCKEGRRAKRFTSNPNQEKSQRQVI